MSLEGRDLSESLRPPHHGALRPVMRRLRDFLLNPLRRGPAKSAVLDLQARNLTLQREVDELRSQAETLRQAAQRFQPVYAGADRVLAPHPVAPFMFVDGTEPVVSPRIITGEYEPGITKALRRLLKPGHVVVEGGANQGFHTLTIALTVYRTGGRVLSFEPDPRAFAVLRHNVTAVGCGRHVELFPNAVYRENKTLRFHTCTSSAQSNIFESDHGSIEVQAVRIGDVLRERNLKPDFVRLDVEGAEPFALEGMWEFLESCPTIKVMFEFFPGGLRKDVSGLSPDDLLTRLSGIGMRFWRVEADGSLRLMTVAEMLSKRVGWSDYVAARNLD